MNPDIQRIAEKWYLVIGQEDGYDIRLTPEKNLLDCIKSVVYYDPAAMPKEEEDFWRERIENVEHWVCDSDLGRVHQSVDIGEIANLTIQLVPLSALTEFSALRDTQERELREKYNKLTVYYSDAVEKLQHENDSLRAELETAKKAHRELLGRYLRVQDELVVLKGCSGHGTNWDPECLECDSKCPESERGKQ